MSLRLTTYEDYIAYFQALAGSHNDIASFFTGDMDRFMNEIKSNLTLRVLWLEPYQPVRILDNLSDNHMGQVNCSMVVYGQAASEKFADRRTEYSNCEVIVKDIMSRMLRDYNNDYDSDFLMMQGLQGFAYGEAESIYGSTRLVGCRLDFNYLRPERLVYNSGKWQ